MEIVEVTCREYSEAVKSPYHIFASAAFNEFNANKCEKVYFLLFRNNKIRMGLIGGRKHKIFSSPYSAPFGGFTYLSNSIKLQDVEVAIVSLKVWAGTQGLTAINITLPPIFYNSSFISKQINCLWREGFLLKQIDLNYSFDLRSFSDRYISGIWRNARKNLKIGLRADLQFCICLDNSDKALAYNIIQDNRENRGYPLQMTWDEVLDTSQMINSDFFLVRDEKNIAIASAIIFQTADRIMQVIYWGDLPKYSHLKTMNYLSFKVFEYYKSQKIDFVDIGPSTEISIPNYGLAEFKESIGCTVDPKFSYSWKCD